MRRSLVLPIVAMGLASTAAAAQDMPGMPRPPLVVEQPKKAPLRSDLISFNPIGVVLQYYTAQYEHALTPTFSLAVNGSYVSFPTFGLYVGDNPRNQNGSWSTDLIARYYPQAEGLRGFGIGASVGYAKLGEESQCTFTQTTSSCTRPSGHTLGVDGDYTWVLGASQHFAVEIGLGAKRYFYKKPNFAEEALPTIKTSIGYAW